MGFGYGDITHIGASIARCRSDTKPHLWYMRGLWQCQSKTKHGSFCAPAEHPVIAYAIWKDHTERGAAG